MSEKNLETIIVEVGTEFKKQGYSTGNNYRSVEFEGMLLCKNTWNRDLEDCGHDLRLFEIPRDEERFIVHDTFMSKWDSVNTTKKIRGPYTDEELSREYPSLASEGGVQVPADLEDVISK